jgi:hypothetical protein
LFENRRRESGAGFLLREAQEEFECYLTGTTSKGEERRAESA